MTRDFTRLARVPVLSYGFRPFFLGGALWAAAIAAVTRFLAPLMSDLSVPLLEISAAAWLAAFGGFVVCYGPMLARPRHP